jgi:hypothetical protein
MRERADDFDRGPIAAKCKDRLVTRSVAESELRAMAGRFSPQHVTPHARLLERLHGLRLESRTTARGWIHDQEERPGHLKNSISMFTEIREKQAES